MTTLIETPLKKYPINIPVFIRVANAALTIKLMSMMVTVGVESWQRYFGDNMHFAKVAIIPVTELELTGGVRRGCFSDDSTGLTDTLPSPLI